MSRICTRIGQYRPLSVSRKVYTEKVIVYYLMFQDDETGSKIELVHNEKKDIWDVIVTASNGYYGTIGVRRGGNYDIYLNDQSFGSVQDDGPAKSRKSEGPTINLSKSGDKFLHEFVKFLYNEPTIITKFDNKKDNRVVETTSLSNESCNGDNDKTFDVTVDTEYIEQGKDSKIIDQAQWVNGNGVHDIKFIRSSGEKPMYSCRIQTDHFGFNNSVTIDLGNQELVRFIHHVTGKILKNRDLCPSHDYGIVLVQDGKKPDGRPWVSEL